MKVKFKIEDIVKHKKEGISPNESKYYDKWKMLPENFHLEYGKNYNIYGIEYDENGNINFLIKDDTGVIYPKFFPSEFFDIIDNRLSKYFVGTKDITYPIKDINFPAFISYKEIVDRGFYYDDFLEFKNDSNEIFSKYKNLIDFEFFDENYPNSINIGLDWTMCPKCDFSWQPKKDSEILKCPKCNTLQNRVIAPAVP